MKKDVRMLEMALNHLVISLLEYTSTVYSMLMSLLLYLLFLLFLPLCIASQHWKALFDQVCEQLIDCLCLVSKESNLQLISSVLCFFFHLKYSLGLMCSVLPVCRMLACKSQLSLLLWAFLSIPLQSSQGQKWAQPGHPSQHRG